MVNDDANPSTKVRRCRISRNKKRYWKKSAKIQDVEDFFCDVSVDAVKGVKKQIDYKFSTLGTDSGQDNLTRRQKAALMKRLKKVEPVEKEEKLSKRQLKRLLLEKSKKQITTKAKASLPENGINRTQDLHDLWAEDGQHFQKELSAVEEYYLLTTKKKLPKEPKTLKHKTSILKHVEVDPAGASYNPPVSKYLDYITKAADEEKRKIKESEKLEHEFALLQQKYATQEELNFELRAGIDETDDKIDEAEDANEIEQKNSGEKKPTIKPKTRRTRKMEQMERKRKELKNMSEFQKEQMHLIYSTRKLNNEINKEIQKQTEFAGKRKVHKLLKRFTDTHRLGRGKFEPYEKPILLTEELPGSLRELKPQGSILTERLKSLQKRNMLSVPGERKKRKLKNRLRIKEREDRKYQEVKLGTRPI